MLCWYMYFLVWWIIWEEGGLYPGAMKVNKEIKYVYYLTTIILPYSFRVFLVLKHFYRTPENVVNLPKMLSYAPLQRKFPFYFI